LILLEIIIFIIKERPPGFCQDSFIDFIFDTDWRPTKDHFGILTMIVGSIAVTVGAMVLSIPLVIACAVLLAEVAPVRIRQFLRPTVELLVGIPSVLYGLVGMLVIVPAIRQIGGTGYSLAAACIVLMQWYCPLLSVSR
jgi:phosphate transport system permease protein